jgi:hypothetical protein
VVDARNSIVVRPDGSLLDRDELLGSRPTD